MPRPAAPPAGPSPERPNRIAAGTGTPEVIALVAVAAGALILATSWGGNQYAWGSGVIIGLFVGGAVALGLFFWAETRAVEAMLPMRLFRNPVFTVCSMLSFIVGFAMLGALTFLPTFLQYVDGDSATVSGVQMLPMVTAPPPAPGPTGSTPASTPTPAARAAPDCAPPQTPSPGAC